MKVTKTTLTLDRVETPSASAYGVEFDLDSAGRPIANTVKYAGDGDDISLKFASPGLPVEHKVIYTVKAISPDGTLVQLPLEEQINNHVASPEDFVGLRFYTRKGFTVLWDFEHRLGVYCPTRDCWAKWNNTFDGACSPQHKSITIPTKEPGKFSDGATTSRAWLAPR